MVSSWSAVSKSGSAGQQLVSNQEIQFIHSLSSSVFVENMAGIYSIECIKNRKVYIGKTKRTFQERWAEHKRFLKAESHCCDDLQRDWIRYGSTAFKFNVIERCPETELARREKHWIALKGSYNEAGRSLYKPKTSFFSFWDKLAISIGAIAGFLLLIKLC